jgi:hypothetical protein
METLKNFAYGFASAFDLCGSALQVPDLSKGFERDALALSGDWWLVGQTIRNSMNQVALHG